LDLGKAAGLGAVPQAGRQAPFRGPALDGRERRPRRRRLVAQAGPDIQAALSAAASSRPDLPGYRADFGDADLQGAALGHARLPRALFNGAHLDHLDVRTGEGPYANFAQAEFKGAKLYGAYLHNAELGGAHFDSPDGRQMTDLRYAQFRGASGVDAHFEGADLRNAVFTRSNVRRTVFRGAQFDRADLRGAVFDGADLTGADFSEAKLAGASFKGAILTGARFIDATFDASTTWPQGFQPPAP